MTPRETFGMLLAAACAVCTPLPAIADDKPITTDSGKIGTLLKRWAAEGTAAGNTGDWYDNRDGGHSQLDVRPYPQLKSVSYTQDEIKSRANWALKSGTLPHVTFGNSSTSAPATATGSNGRQAYSQTQGLQMLAKQYRANNLYIYPEHRDHDAPTDPDGGYGDLFPTNTPYLILSQGSSGSDQPFMRAIPFTLAAFRPDVKKKLIETGMLMPVVQMILRQTYKAVSTPADYLTGKAHPTVFAGHLLDPQRMVELAHEVTLDTIPPLVRLKLKESEPTRAGRDYFDPAPGEIHAETESAISMIFRSASATRRIVVSAEESFDLNGKPLRFTWVVLRGKAENIQIKHLNDAKTVAEITIHWHCRAPVEPGGALESSRVDIGVFAHNGHYYSPPAFVTSYTLPNEFRVFGSDGRLAEIDYGMGESTVSVKDWTAFHEALISTNPTPLAKLTTAGFTESQMSELRSMAMDFREASAKAVEAEQRKRAAEEAENKATGDEKKKFAESTKSARDAARDLAKTRDEILARTIAGTARPWKELITSRLNEMARDERFFLDHDDWFTPLPSAALAQKKRLVSLRVVRETSGPLFELPMGEPTPWELAQLCRFHGELLTAKLPGLQHRWQPYLVDFRISFPKDWRDMYHYDESGSRTGWTRYTETSSQEFTGEGLAVTGRDLLGRCATASPVQYHVAPAGAQQKAPWEWPPMRFTTLPRVVRYEYSGDNDRKGKMVEVSPAEAVPTIPDPAGKP